MCISSIALSRNIHIQVLKPFRLHQWYCYESWNCTHFVSRQIEFKCGLIREIYSSFKKVKVFLTFEFMLCHLKWQTKKDNRMCKPVNVPSSFFSSYLRSIVHDKLMTFYTYLTTGTIEIFRAVIG